jgi:SAM-dependent methyltransferase
MPRLKNLRMQFPRLWENKVTTPHYCPICEKVSFFTHFGGREEVECGCTSLERHRFLQLYLETINFYENASAKILHIAPEPCFINKFREIFKENYTTLDLNERADLRMDVTDIKLPDSTFDMVICSHVLEHVQDDISAIKELCRVLKPIGFGLFIVPIMAVTTYENPSITSAKERQEVFGQFDHVRNYGYDFADRLLNAGFVVRELKAKLMFSEETIDNVRLDGDEIIYRGEKRER